MTSKNKRKTKTMNPIIKKLLKDIKARIYRADNKQDLDHLEFTISLIQNASHVIHHKDELKALIKLRKQLKDRYELIEGLEEIILN